jgi:hypothetical protein
VNRRAVSFTRSHHPDVLPIAEGDLFVQSVLIGDAGFGVVYLKISAIVGGARTVPPAATPAALERKRRRDGASTGWVLDMGVFVGGVLCTLSAWVIGIRAPCGSG